jgi:hypothetical protein
MKELEKAILNARKKRGGQTLMPNVDEIHIDDDMDESDDDVQPALKRALAYVAAQRKGSNN